MTATGAAAIVSSYGSAADDEFLEHFQLLARVAQLGLLFVAPSVARSQLRLQHAQLFEPHACIVLTVLSAGRAREKGGRSTQGIKQNAR